MAPRKSAKAKKVVDNDQDSDYDEEGGGTKRGASSGDEFEGESSSPPGAPQVLSADLDTL